MDPNDFNITINPQGLAGPAADKYRRQVREHLTWIHRTKVGNILLRAIRFHGMAVEIRPFTGVTCNAATGSETAPNGSTRAYVRYSPDTFSSGGACPVNTTRPNSGLLWDEILFHELVHVFRIVSGKLNQRPLSGGLTAYGNNEEFYAVVITNIYISDRANRIKTSLRADHAANWAPLAPDLAKPFGLFTASWMVYGLIQQFVADNRGLSAMLANTKTAFNPIAEYLSDPSRAEALSKKALAQSIAAVIGQLVKMF